MTNDNFPADAPTELPAAEQDLLELLASAEGEEYNTFLPSFAQQRLWFLNELEPGNPVYNIPVALRLEGQLNTDALAAALTEIVHRHEALRTTFTTLDARPVQVVGPPQSMPMPLVDISSLPATDREAEAQRLLHAEARRPFDLGRGPLTRANLLRLAPNDHILMLSMHHIVSDGWSLGIMIRELMTLYQSSLTGQPAALPELEVQYADYAVWQREWLQGDVLDKQLAYWKEQLAHPPVLELPTDHLRPPMQTFNGAIHLVKLSATLYGALKNLSQREGVTLFMTLLAAFKVLLSRYSGQTDLVVGTPIAGRTRVETEPLIGLFVNTLALRTDLAGNPTFRELLARVRGVTLGAYAHQDVPFERLVEELQPERSLSHTPLFQVMVMLMNTPLPELAMAGLTLRRIDLSTGTAKFDVTLLLEERDGGITAQWEYNTDLFNTETIKRMAGHYETLLESIVAQPEQHIAALPLLTQAERQQLLVEWNDTARAYPAAECMHELFAAQVARTPDAVAAIAGAEQLTYAALNQRADQLAQYLRTLGVGPEVRVGVLMERSLEMLTGLLAIQKAGGAYVPLDPQYPQERVAFMLQDADMSVLLTQARLAEKLPADTPHVVCVDADWAHITAQTESEIGAQTTLATTLDNLAYIIYTSGSTGRPKGVAITHRSAATFLHWTHETFSQAELAGVLASTSICFDLSVFELFAPLTCGGTAIIGENALALPALAATHTITLVNTVPSAMTELMRIKGVPASVRTVNLAGEPLKRTLVDQLYQQPTIERVLNLYGPSEDTTYSTYAVLPRTSERAPSIGRPVANSQVYLLDQTWQLVPQGVPGEVYIGGAGLARGYLTRPELTAEKFIPDPFAPEPGQRLYRTGDLARYLPNGELDFLGRMDHQVKVRGYRIELGEIEAVLSRHEAVRACVVVARDEGADKRLVAYVASQPTGPAFDLTEMRAHLRAALPEYMVPAALVVLAELPLTPNGKVDRKALPEPEQARPELKNTYVAPRTALEETLVGIWAEVLRVERVGVEDNFFELGGHSLLATQLLARVRGSLQIEVPLRSVFETPTVAGLARVIEQNQQQPGSLRPKIQARPRGRQNLQHMLAKLEQMAEGEAKDLLNERKPAQ